METIIEQVYIKRLSYRTTNTTLKYGAVWTTAKRFSIVDPANTSVNFGKQSNTKMPLNTGEQNKDEGPPAAWPLGGGREK